MAGRAPANSTLSPLFYVFAASQQAGTLVGMALRGAPLQPAEYAMYSALRELEPASPTELARHLGMPVTTALDGIRAMVGSGHATRIDNPDDGRSYFLVLTRSGHRAHDETAASLQPGRPQARRAPGVETGDGDPGAGRSARRR